MVIMRQTATLLLLGVAAATAAHAATATLTLSRDVALWSDVVVAHIEGSGCTGGAEPPVVYDSGGAWFVDIELTGCDFAPPTPFSLAVPLGPLAPQQYTVRLLKLPPDISSPLEAPYDTAPLAVHRDASLGIEVPETPTDAAPFNLVLTGPASTFCFGLDPPTVQGNVISASFHDDCPVLPRGGPHVFREEFPLGPLPAGKYEVRFFDTTPYPITFLERLEFVVHDADHGCAPSSSVLCLQDGRFAVEAEWTDFSGNSGHGHALPLGGDANSGLLWFFSPDNVEVTVKVLEGCPVNGHWWVFLSSGSTVEYTVTVTDTVTGVSREYTNDSGEAAPLVTDTQAFDC
jgi:hypothetical protein